MEAIYEEVHMVSAHRHWVLPKNFVFFPPCFYGKEMMAQNLGNVHGLVLNLHPYRCYTFILSFFNYYCCKGQGDVFSVSSVVILFTVDFLSAPVNTILCKLWHLLCFKNSKALAGSEIFKTNRLAPTTMPQSLK